MSLVEIEDPAADERQRAACAAVWQDRVWRLLLELAEAAVLVRPVPESVSTL